LPFVMVGRYPDERVRYVDIDNVAAARMAVDHLARLGHRRIGTVTGPLKTPSAADRLEGYRQAMETHRLPVDEALKLVISGGAVIPAGLPTIQTDRSSKTEAEPESAAGS